MTGNINGQTEHVLNRKPRINGVIVDGNTRLERVKGYTKPEMRRKIKNVFKVINANNVKNGGTSRTATVTSSANDYTVTTSEGSFVITILKFGMRKAIKLKEEINLIL